ncbi:hypothetical protein E2C01_083105 [Portunus trituberculatus]|uniref:Uncharacterized protein n=1 Tax=Portunus trituberculatus TaxID=210409 RepID=A0A5B7J3L8_PORTR|nr:hypothetical protein [Portunus trituberculatus]
MVAGLCAVCVRYTAPRQATHNKSNKSTASDERWTRAAPNRPQATVQFSDASGRVHRLASVTCLITCWTSASRGGNAACETLIQRNTKRRPA